MFREGDYVVYGASGVCVVDGNCASPFGGGDLRVYYKLHPIDDPTFVIYALAEGGKITLRSPINVNDAELLLSTVSETIPLEIHNEKQRREIYRTAISEANPKELLRVIKTVSVRRAEAFVAHRQLAVTDTDSERTAKINLFNELSLVLDKSYSEIEQHIRSELEKNEVLI